MVMSCRLESEYPARAKVPGVNHTAKGTDHVIFPNCALALFHPGMPEMVRQGRAPGG